MEKEIEMMVDYIQNVLYHPKNATLDTSLFSEETEPLAEALKKLGSWSIEANEFAYDLATKDSSLVSAPSAENTLIENISKIQNRFYRMTEQIGSVVSSPCDKSNSLSFDEMVFELQKRTSALENERNLFIKFTESASERIIVLDEKSGEMVYANKIARNFHGKTMDYIDSADQINLLSGCSYQNTYSSWIHTVNHPNDDDVEYYQVHSLYIIWQGHGAIAHMFTNVTEAKKNEELARRDALTNAYSRSFGMEYIKNLFKQKIPFALAFVDIDYLKYCNDSLGHLAGDNYLKEVVSILNDICNDGVLCRSGGDEFLLISQSLDDKSLINRLEDKRLELAESLFPNSQVHKSFSYGVADTTNSSVTSLSMLIGIADEKMYQNKLNNKQSNHAYFKDDRIQ